ncbi:threonine/serine exporter family protein, partial [Corallococcus aberystwythensis]
MTREPEVDEDTASAFLLELAKALHLAYQPSLLVEARVRRAAKAWGLDVEVFTLQSLAMTEVLSPRRLYVVFERLPLNPHLNLVRAGALLRLADAIPERGVRLPEARAELERILKTHPPYPEWLVFVAYGVYGVAVAARVGG